MVSHECHVSPVTDSLRKMELRLSGEDLRRVEDWRSSQRPIPNRNEAIRILIRLALSAVEAKGNGNEH